MIYFALPFIIVIISTDFNSKTIKDTLSTGISRVNYYLAKLFLMNSITILLIFFIALLSFMFGLIKNGMGEG